MPAFAGMTAKGSLRSAIPLALARCEIDEALALAGEFFQKRRRLPPIALCLVEAPHIGIDLIEADRIGIEHRPTAPGRKAIAGQIDDVDIAGPERDAFFEDLGAFVDQPIDAAL